MNIVITGASRGLGKAIAEKFAAQGHSIFLCARNGERLRETTERMQQRYPEANLKCKAADLSKKEEAIAFAHWIAAEAGSVDVLINNAGSFVPGGVHNEPDGALEEMIGINLYSAYHLTRALLPSMMDRRSGHIFNMCSIASVKAYANGGAYSISKFALLGFTRNLREEMMSHNIRVTAVLPGAAYTDSWKSSGVEPDRIMEAEDIAALVYASTLLSPQACVEEIVVRPQLGDL